VQFFEQFAWGNESLVADAVEYLLWREMQLNRPET